MGSRPSLTPILHARGNAQNAAPPLASPHISATRWKQRRHENSVTWELEQPKRNLAPWHVRRSRQAMIRRKLKVSVVCLHLNIGSNVLTYGIRTPMKNFAIGSQM